MWGTFGPITYAVQLAYDWSDGTIALMANWGGIAYCFSVFPVSYLFVRCQDDFVFFSKWNAFVFCKKK